MPKTSSITSPSFFRKLGKGNLLNYLEHFKHPLLEKAEKILSAEKEEMSAEISQQIQLLLYSDTNSKLSADANHFDMLSSLTSEKGQIKVQQFINSNSKYKSLSEEAIQPYDLSMKLFIEDPEIFDEIYSNLQIENTQRWQFYSSSGIIPTIVENKEQALRHFENDLKGLIQNNVLNLDSYVRNEDRWIFILKYPDKPTRIEDFKSGKICPLTVQKPTKVILIFYPQDGCMQIHLHKNGETLRNQIVEAFIIRYVSNREDYKKKLISYSINLEKFKTLHVLKLLDKSLKIDSVKVIGFEFMKLNSKVIVSIRNIEADSLLGAFRESKQNIDNTKILSVKLLFKFEGRGKSRERKLTLFSNGKNTLKGSESRDEAMRKCLVYWGIMNI